ncbi:DNA-3-methyladenine glycosylase [Actinotalea sp.]|uniref:DNA-3-methyladenine glycosylase n=1 Tax=Actinotalea sp. TaxID=1872145 RepID=UPI00356B2DFF
MSPRGADRRWFARSAVEVAPELLGAVLTTTRAGATVSVRLTEVEAYGGTGDPVSHAYRGRSARNASMYLAGGHLYVYRHLGLHHCVNVVTGPEGEAGAVLLRAGEVIEGVAAAHDRRAATGVVRREVDLASGPARLAVALGLGPGDDGVDLLGARVGGGATADGIRLLLSVTPREARSGPRVGVNESGRDPELFAWRFWLPGEATVSTDRGTSSRRGSERQDGVTGRSPRTAD